MTSNAAVGDLPDLGWTFGDRMRKVRRALGLGQAQFADLIGVPRSVVGAWELGTNVPPHVRAIANSIQLATGVSARWVLGETENPRPAGGPNGGAAKGRDRYTARDSNPEPADLEHRRLAVTLTRADLVLAA